jgi:hypothetical protein
MEIQLKCNNYGYDFIVKAENVNLVEDVEERIYDKKEDGKLDTSKPPFRDINNDILEQLTRVLDDAIYYRKRDFDSSQLIEGLFQKLPESIRQEVLTKLNKEYFIEPDSQP